MYTPSLNDFLKYTKRGNVIPVYKQINADLDTPVSAFLKIKKDDYAFLFESVEGQERIARYSFLGSNPALIFKSKSGSVQIIYSKQKKTQQFTAQNPLDEIKKIMRGFKAVAIKGLPRFCGGLVGYMGYDTVRFFEQIPDKNRDDLELPDSVFVLSGELLIFDHVNHTIKIVSNVILPRTCPKTDRREGGSFTRAEARSEDDGVVTALRRGRATQPQAEEMTALPTSGFGTGSKDKRKFSVSELAKNYAGAVKKIDEIHRQLISPVIDKKGGNNKINRDKCLISNYKKSEFKGIVNKAKVYIKRGDIIQVVLSQRFKVKMEREPLEIYRGLRRINPSPYMFFLKLKDITLIGASPEMLVRCEDGVVQARPIAGTRPRGKTDTEDKKLEAELLKDVKEKAEHIMLVDLGRNDLGRVCRKGKVEISEFMTVERYSHVMHLVSEIKGVLDKKFDVYDVLKACFPAGTVSGSPKIRAMEIIDELENIRRGPYAGCVGYFSFSHNMDTCITIRTIVVKGNICYVQAGAGIVADSIPEKEYLESVNKSKALIEAIIN